MYLVYGDPCCTFMAHMTPKDYKVSSAEEYSLPAIPHVPVSQRQPLHEAIKHPRRLYVRDQRFCRAQDPQMCARPRVLVHFLNRRCACGEAVGGPAGPTLAHPLDPVIQLRGLAHEVRQNVLQAQRPSYADHCSRPYRE
jgi:hypothetical protein